MSKYYLRIMIETTVTLEADTRAEAIALLKAHQHSVDLWRSYPDYKPGPNGELMGSIEGEAPKLYVSV